MTLALITIACLPLVAYAAFQSGYTRGWREGQDNIED